MTAYQIGYVVGTLAAPVLYMVVIGTIYYWIKKRSIPYRQALLNRWVITSSLVLFLVGLVGRTSSYLQQESSHIYPAKDVREFTAGCVDTAKARLGNDVAEKLCSCTITEIQKAHTYGEFKQLVSDMTKSKTPPAELQAIATSCAQKQST